jgi:hypothetical protein
MFVQCKTLLQRKMHDSGLTVSEYEHMVINHDQSIAPVPMGHCPRQDSR